MTNLTSDPPITVINRFTVGSEGDVLPELARTGDLLRQQPGFEFLVRAKLAQRRDVHVQFGYWRSHTGFLDAIRQPAFADHIARLSTMAVDTEADQAVRVAQVLAPDPCAGTREAVGVVMEYLLDRHREGFERELLAEAQAYLAYPGFGGVDLLRSVLRPLRYRSISWWYDPDACTAALAADSSRQPSLAGTTVRVERTDSLAYERAIATT